MGEPLRKRCFVKPRSGAVKHELCSLVVGDSLSLLYHFGSRVTALGSPISFAMYLELVILVSVVVGVLLGCAGAWCCCHRSGTRKVSALTPALIGPGDFPGLGYGTKPVAHRR